MGEKVLQFNSPIVAKMAEMYRGLSRQGKLGFVAVFLILWHRFGGKILIKNGKIVHFVPSCKYIVFKRGGILLTLFKKQTTVVYELIANAFFAVNWVLDGLCYLQPDKSEWNEPHSSVSVEALKSAGGTDLDVVKRQILEQKDVAYVENDLVRLYDTLPAVKTEEILIGHTWNGKILRTNRSVLDLAEWFIVRPLSYLGFAWGKRYVDQHTGDPLLFNWAKTIYFPIPLWGNVCVTDIKWRGVSTGTMNYDSQNWKDYFRILEHDPVSQRLVLLGVWTARSKAGGWFTLTWDPMTPTE